MAGFHREIKIPNFCLLILTYRYFYIIIIIIIEKILTIKGIFVWSIFARAAFFGALAELG